MNRPPLTSSRAALPTLLLAGALLAPLALAQTPPPAAPTAQIVALVTGLRSDSGVVTISLYDGPGPWLHAPARHCEAWPHGRQASCVLEPLTPGATYGIAFGHDENHNGRVDRNFIGIPTEGYGFSNDVHPRLSAPGFDSARFTFSGGVQTVRMTAQY